MTADGPGRVRYRRALECLIGVPATDGNRVDVLGDGDEAISAMLEAVLAATATVDLVGFGRWSGAVGEEVAGALASRAGAGVRVRVLHDALGSRLVDDRLVERMASAGARVEWFRPLSNWRITQSTHRGHRRILVCDGEVAFTGGVGTADSWRPHGDEPGWRDTHVRVRGPAVNGLRGAFVDNWAETRHSLFDEDVDRLPVQPSPGTSAVQVVRGSAETGWGDLSTLVRSLIGLARRRLRISADYFVPDAGALGQLRTAVDRGVGVELLRPGYTGGTSQLASEAQYGRLIEAGVRVWAFRPSPLKARVVTVDGEVAVVGPLNFSARSLTFNDEVVVVVFDPEVVRRLDGHFEDDLARSSEVDAGGWGRRSPLRRVAEAPVGFLARWM